MGNYASLEKEWHETNPHESFNMWLMDELLKARANSPQQPQGEICEWKVDVYKWGEGYATTCGEVVQSILALDGMRFCPYCGRKLSPVR